MIKQLSSRRTWGRNVSLLLLSGIDVISLSEKLVFTILQTLDFLIDQFPSFTRLQESLISPNLKEVT